MAQTWQRGYKDGEVSLLHLSWSTLHSYFSDPDCQVVVLIAYVELHLSLPEYLLSYIVARQRRAELSTLVSPALVRTGIRAV
jgi:hypothetical protein